MPTTAQPIEVAGATTVMIALGNVLDGTCATQFACSVDPIYPHWQASSRGAQNAKWITDHPEKVIPYRGQWIAVKDGHVVSAAATVERLHAYLSEAGIRDALFSYVPEDDRWNYLIA